MRIGIVGAGMTGLALTHTLAERGVDSVTYEATGEPGGVIDSRVVDGRVIEVGPQRLRLSDPVAELVDSVGLRRELVAANDSLPLYVYSRGALRRVPRSATAFVKTDLLSPTAKLRVLAEPLTGDAKPDESIAEVFTRKFGREAYENLAGPIVGGTFGSDPAEMPARHALESLFKLEQRHGNLLVPAAKRLLGSSESPPPVSFERGLQRLPRALADAHDDRVRFETPIRSIRESGDEVVVTGVDGDVERFDHVVVTTPASETADLLRESVPKAAALEELTYNPLALVHLVSDANATGFGYQVRRGESLRTLGVSWNASLFDRDGVYTAFLGGMNDAELCDRADEEIGRIATREFERVLGAEADALHVETLPAAFPAYDSSWSALERVDLPERIHLATNYTSRMGIPSRVREANGLAETFADEAS
ncbi:protoporphyrinogen oxidase [Haloterrigena salifodinae]|uniref:protoporphyrinogen oxidase n=1 Tax=Haloterrigena salifodinae TaxID=2675099 RepID=UPI000F8829D9|nr:protoporphyrinogen oxidase [Haloterrigena salifodinae]